MKRRPTIEDVAERTALSISTVSLVLNNKPNVSVETREKVRQAILDLGYHPHRSARGLASKSSGNIGFIISEDHFSQAEPFYTKIFLGTEFEARNTSYYILLTSVSDRFNANGSIPRFLLERNVDGVIIAGRINEKLIEYIDQLGIPVILIDYAFKRKSISAILIDNNKGAQIAVGHLIRGGHKSIGFIGGDIKHPSIAARFEGYKQSLTDHGLQFNTAHVIIDEKDTGTRNGYNAMERMYRNGGAAPAIFAANDAMAIGCIRYLKSINKKVPGDIAIMGFDDIEVSSLVEPRLTTIHVFKEDMGKLAVQRLVEMIRSKTKNITTVHVPVELVVRESCGIKNGDTLDANSSASTIAV